jgi:hypothetical protein
MQRFVRRRQPGVAETLAAWALGVPLLLGLPAAAPAAEPTDQEMLFLYELNRARHDPADWAVEMGIQNTTGGDGQPADLVGVPARPPLALNEILVGSARFKAGEMASFDYFAHQSAVTGTWPNLLVRQMGYPLATMVNVMGGFIAIPDDSNQVESIACGYGPGAQDFSQAINALVGLIVDTGVPGLGHRHHLLGFDDYDFNAHFREAGAGFGSNGGSQCRNYWAFHTGVEDVERTFLTGVVFADQNADGLYDPSEGLPGVTVTVSGVRTSTNAAGGWSMEVTSGTHVVTCQGGAFAGTGSASVPVASANREVDCISGLAGAVVDFSVPEPGAAPGALAATGALGWLAAARRRCAGR